jgi:indolepyruvate ferredoxin oxidoreductase
MMEVFRLLANFRFLRGTALDSFGYTAERRQERADIADYCALLDTLKSNLGKDNYGAALELAGLPGKLRGFGHVKERNREALLLRREELLRQFRGEQSVESVVKIVEAA